MGIGLYNNFVIVDDQFQGGQYTALAENINMFNGASNGALILKNDNLKGFFPRRRELARLASSITRRDLTSTATVTPIFAGNSQEAGVRLACKFGPVAYSLGALELAEYTPDEISFILGKMYAEDKLQFEVHTLVLAIETALRNQGASFYDASALTPATMAHAHLINGKGKLGDAMESLVCWIMYSKPYTDLNLQGVADKIFGVANTIVYGGKPGTLNLPTVVADTPALFQAGTPNKYVTLGLRPGAGTITETGTERFISSVLPGTEQLIITFQGEFDLVTNVGGFTWDMVNGGPNPDQSTLGTGSNWDPFQPSHKLRAGVAILTQ